MEVGLSNGEGLGTNGKEMTENEQVEVGSIAMNSHMAAHVPIVSCKSHPEVDIRSKFDPHEE